MNKEEIKKGLHVMDRDYPEMGVGEVVEIKSTVFEVKFEKDTHTYDFPHARYLDIIKKDCGCIGSCAKDIINNRYFRCMDDN